MSASRFSYVNVSQSARDRVSQQHKLQVEVEADQLRASGSIRDYDNEEERRRIERALEKGGYNNVSLVQRSKPGNTQGRQQVTHGHQPAKDTGSDTDSSDELPPALSAPLTPSASTVPRPAQSTIFSHSLCAGASTVPRPAQGTANERKLGQTSSGRHFFLEDTDPASGWLKLDVVGAEHESMDGVDTNRRRRPRSNSMLGLASSPTSVQGQRATPGRLQMGQQSSPEGGSPSSPSSPRQGSPSSPGTLRRPPRKAC